MNNSSIDRKKIESLLPHREPMLLLDKLTNIVHLKSATAIVNVKKTSFFMSQFISRGEDTIVEAKVHLVFVNPEGKPMRIPDCLFQDFKPYFCDSIKI